MLTMRVEGIPKAIKNSNAKVLTAKAILKFVNTGAPIVLKNVRIKVPKFTEETHDSLYVTKNTGRWPYDFKVSTDLDSAVYLHEGTEAGYTPNIENITPWAEAKGIPPWALAYHISLKGTKANPFMEKGVEMSKPTLLRMVKALAVDIESSVER